MVHRTVSAHSVLLPRLLTAIGAGSLLAAPACGGKTQANGSLSDGVDGVAQTSEEQGSSEAAEGKTTKPAATSKDTGTPPSIAPTGTPTDDTVVNTITDPPATAPSTVASDTDTTSWTSAISTPFFGETSEGTTNIATSSESTAPAIDGGAAPVACEFGYPQQFCLNVQQMENQARYGVGNIPLEPPRGDDEIAAAWDANGCMKREWVATGCCNPAELPGEPQGDGSCCYVACEGACCGRPFVVNGAALVADVVAGTSWLLPDDGATNTTDEVNDVGVDLDARARRVLGDAWLADAQMEHASIASFAQFSLDLLRLGAPPELIRDSHLAGLDEIEHARVAFSIAERLSGVALGPAALPVGHLDVHSVQDAIAAAIVEGCIGETLASAVLARQAQRCTDPKIASYLTRIAHDELRHAELAWRFVAWSLARYGAMARTTVEATFAAVWAKPSVAPESLGLEDPQLHAAGRISSAEWSLVVESVVTGVLKPAAVTLLEGTVGMPAEKPSEPHRKSSHRVWG